MSPGEEDEEEDILVCCQAKCVLIRPVPCVYQLVCAMSLCSKAAFNYCVSNVEHLSSSIAWIHNGDGIGMTRQTDTNGNGPRRRIPSTESRNSQGHQNRQGWTWQCRRSRTSPATEEWRQRSCQKLPAHEMSLKMDNWRVMNERDLRKHEMCQLGLSVFGGQRRQAPPHHHEQQQQLSLYHLFVLFRRSLYTYWIMAERQRIAVLWMDEEFFGKACGFAWSPFEFEEPCASD